MCSHLGGTDMWLWGCVTEMDVDRQGRIGAASTGFPCDGHTSRDPEAAVVTHVGP